MPWVWWCRHGWFQATGWADWIGLVCSSSNSPGVRIPSAEDFGAVIDSGRFSADRGGYEDLIDWAAQGGAHPSPS